MTDSILMNDGTSFILKNDGGQILLNRHGVGGVDISGIHATQITKRRTKFIHVEFTFWLISSLLKRVEIKLLQFKLHPYVINPDKLRESFRLPLTRLRQKLKPLSKQALKEALNETLEASIQDGLNDPMWRFEFLYKLIKKMRNNGS